MGLFVISQVLVCIGALLYGVSLLLKTKQNLLFIQIISGVIFSLHFFLLDSLIGAVLVIVELCRAIAFYFIEKYGNKSQARISVGIAFIVISIVCSVLTWENWQSIFPVMGLLSVNIFLMGTKLIPLKLSCIFMIICTTIYLALIGSVFGVVTEIIILAFGVYGIIKDFKDKNKKQALTI